MVKTILIDLGGVYFEDGTEKATKKMYKYIDKPKEVIDRIFKSKPLKEGFLYRKGKLTEKEFWKKAIEKLGIKKDMIPELKELWFSSYVPIQGTKEIVLKLKENYKMVVCSGNIKERVDYLNNKYDFKKNFDEFFFSYEIGFHKWEIDFWKILAKRYNPNECIFIDDEQGFFNFANRQGFKTILFKSARQLKSDLKGLGINV